MAWCSFMCHLSQNVTYICNMGIMLHDVVPKQRYNMISHFHMLQHDVTFEMLHYIV